MIIKVLDKEIKLNKTENCPICGDFSKLKKQIKTININSDLFVDLRECKNCNHLFVADRPNQEDLLYMYSVGSSFVYGGNKSIINLDNNINFDDRLDNGLNNLFGLIKKTEKNYSKGKYLEIGIGSGGLFKYFQSQGYDCYGVEPGIKHNNGNIYQKIEEIDKNIKFDIIVCQDVMEHIEDPKKYLHLLATYLNKGGRLYMSFPNSDSIFSKIMNTKWPMIRPLGHLHFFSKKSTIIICNENGLEIKKITGSTYGVNLLYFGGFIHYFKQIIKLFIMRDQWIVLAVKK